VVVVPRVDGGCGRLRRPATCGFGESHVPKVGPVLPHDAEAARGRKPIQERPEATPDAAVVPCSGVPNYDDLPTRRVLRSVSHQMLWRMTTRWSVMRWVLPYREPLFGSPVLSCGPCRTRSNQGKVEPVTLPGGKAMAGRLSLDSATHRVGWGRTRDDPGARLTRLG
jgi:hypothetical protein